MRIIQYDTIGEAMKASFDFFYKGIKCKRIGQTGLQVWDENVK